MDSYRRQMVMVAVLLGLGIGLSGCSSSKKNPTEPEPEPEAPTVVENFSGQVEQFGVECDDFSMENSGTIMMQITDLQPLTTLTMGLRLGQQDTTLVTGCATFVEDLSVRVFQTLASAGLAAGEYCVCILDVGNIFPGETVDYTLEVTHPE